MCEICKSMLAAEHTEQQPSGVELCPVCRRFPLDVDVPLDLSQWDYVDPDFKNAVESNALEPPPMMDSMPVESLESSEDLLPEDVYDEEEEHVRTCYHCYQADSEQAELCPVCGDSYLPPSLRQPHKA
ncbi:MAG TPA: hypothetical protein VNM47_08320 [Terriglobia bacterium]|nr:hypothetical protein [Terriglobia bacterium]